MDKKTSNGNMVGPVVGENISITQIYAPGAIPMQPRDFETLPGARPFSVEWIIFSQQSVPFFGREVEVEAVLAFLNAPEIFSWWAITGDGGSGKSRLALEMMERLPNGWQGGFMMKENINLRDTAVWRPKTNYLWVVDYSADHYESLGRIIASWRQLLRTSPFKVRLLLLERSYSIASGWWSELTGAMNSNRAAIVNTLYSPPLALPPLAGRSRTFLNGVGEQLDGEMRDKLLQGLASIGNERLETHSQFGNPLLLLLLAAEIVTQGADSLNDDSPDMGNVVERHLGRELDLLRTRCKGAGLDFQSILYILFATTSMYPINFPQEHDLVILESDKEIFLVKNHEGKLEIPTLAQARSFWPDIDKDRKIKLDNLQNVTGVQDVEPYLDVLSEVGYAQSYSYSIQPDLVGETLIRLMLNAAGTKMSLKRRRGEIDRLRLAYLVEGCFIMSKTECAKNWARLDDDALIALIDHARQRGQSIRSALLMIRRINMFRTAKVPFDPERVFAPNDVHAAAPQVGSYFAKILGAIGQQTFHVETSTKLARDSDAWLLPYVDFLLDLSPLERARLGLIICRIDNFNTLRRLTNLSNFLGVIASSLSYAHRALGSLSKSERETFAELVESAIDFSCELAYPILMANKDPDYLEPHRQLVWTLIQCSYGVANSLCLFGREATSNSRQRALNGLEVARKTLATAKDSHQMAYVERNTALLKAADLDGHGDITTVYSNTLAAMASFANGEDFTATMLDAIRYLAERTDAESATIAAYQLLEQAPPELLVGEQILPAVVYVLEKIDWSNCHTQTGDSLFPILSNLLGVMRSSKSENAEEELKRIIAVAINATLKVSEREPRLVELFNAAHTWMEAGNCSLVFMRAILSSSAIYVIMRGCKATASLPFKISVKELERTIWEALLGDGLSSDLAMSVETVIEASAVFALPGAAPIMVKAIGLKTKDLDIDTYRDDLNRLSDNLSGPSLTK